MFCTHAKGRGGDDDLEFICHPLVLTERREALLAADSVMVAQDWYMCVFLVVCTLPVFSCSNACFLKQAKGGGVSVSWGLVQFVQWRGTNLKGLAE
jgi:hypothetical protein